MIPTGLTTRIIRRADIPSVDPLLRSAYGNPRSFQTRLERLISLEPEGWLLVEETGASESVASESAASPSLSSGGAVSAAPLGMGGIVVMGRTGYVGLVAADPASQRRGIGTMVMRGLIDIAAKRGCARVLLDASDAGRPLYEKLGFVATDTVGVWVREEGVSSSGRPLVEGYPPIASLAETGHAAIRGAVDLPRELLEFDRRCWGEERDRVLASFAADDPALVLVARDRERGAIQGYAIVQREGGILGPFVALDPPVAEALARRAVEFASQGPLVAYLPGANQAGERLLRSLGFSLSRVLTHMRLGEALDQRRRVLVYSQANLALG